jgi:hypothetical protein
LYTPECVFGNPDAGKPAEQKDVLMTGMKSVGLDHASKTFRDEVTAMKIMSAVSGQGESRIIALVKVEMGKDSAFYQWVVLVPYGTWVHDDSEWKGAWTAQTVLVAPAPTSHTAELLEQPVEAVADASVAVAASPALLSPVAIFASGILLSGCIFGRKEILAKFTAPSDGLQEPLMA